MRLKGEAVHLDMRMSISRKKSCSVGRRRFVRPGSKAIVISQAISKTRLTAPCKEPMRLIKSLLIKKVQRKDLKIKPRTRPKIQVMQALTGSRLPPLKTQKKQTLQRQILPTQMSQMM